MLNLERKSFWIIGLSVAVIAFALLYIGIVAIAQANIAAENVIAYIVFSLIVGCVAAILIYFRLKAAFLTYIAGIILGFIIMYNAFLSDNAGWGDLIGVISLMFWIVIGLGVGLLIQLAMYLYKRFKKQ